MKARNGVWGLAALLLAAPLAGQSLEQRVRQAPDGTARLSFAAREGVCGNGRNISTGGSSSRDGWYSDCDPGPARVALDVRAGRVTSVRTYVGGRWRATEGRTTDLGNVAAREAAEFFLALAGSGNSVRGDPLTPAVLADSVTVWPQLLRIGRDASIRRDLRRQAVFWLSQEAAEEATRGLADLAEDEREDRDVREHAVFALSQLREGAGIPALIRLARTDRDPSVRKKAIFWLGQSEDPRAIGLFEELLAGRP